MRALLLVLCLALSATVAGDAPARPRAAPPRADTSFAALVARLSEPGGYFDTDNLVSNEASYLHVMGKLSAAGVRGGAYLGVGPDQNFSYIARVRPALALLVDIRRDNLLQHLLYRAIFELSSDRGSYLALLLARPVERPDSAGEALESILGRLDRPPPPPAGFEAVHARVRERVASFGVPLSADDLATLRRIHAEFAAEGLDLRFRSHGRPPQAYYPTLRRLLLERDREGRPASYLASEEDFRFVRSLQAAGRVVPVVGDLAGGRALREIADLLRERGERVTAFYTSNVEYYLAREARLDDFVDNLRRLPAAPGAVVIRSVFRMGHPQSVPGYASTQLLQEIGTLVREYDAGRIRGYHDLVTVGSLDLR